VADALAIALCHYYLQQRSPQILASTAGSLSRKIIKKL
jgi:type III secretion system FlhB-like substrate exporter